MPTFRDYPAAHDHSEMLRQNAVSDAEVEFRAVADSLPALVKAEVDRDYPNPSPADTAAVEQKAGRILADAAATARPATRPRNTPGAGWTKPEIDLKGDNQVNEIMHVWHGTTAGHTEITLQPGRYIFAPQGGGEERPVTIKLVVGDGTEPEAGGIEFFARSTCIYRLEFGAGHFELRRLG